MADDDLDFANTTLVNGVTRVNYATEKTNDTSSIGKAINMVINSLTTQNVPGINGVVGNYDVNLIGDCCYKILNEGLINADTGYGVIINRSFFQAAGLM
ncbi:hypothetical protein SD70_27220 [Gordoniibacillus kamchatkensis]|uniref:Uncharacterized protein n=1 Tax=Gordoniibacillus kamchatkensis TaxID=1590651 RepID=A0ABR5AB74_9BACL|nr:hypothetical protein [Paenibacillus sp. VKM B-2647]KIL38309.1 hypothetical protein SD70_27220 [Paenibacillus sp. VKM B-2647]